MKKSNTILHISPTPLVGSPAKISQLLNNKYLNSISIIFQDYPQPLKGIFSQNSILFDENKDFAKELIKSAEIIHIHNFLTREQEDIILSTSKDSVKFIYQVHSPLREGPLFSSYVDGSKIDYDLKLVVGQYQPRLYQNYIIVPNITLHKPSINLIRKGEKPKVIFTPSHKRVGGRWSNKVSKKLDEVLKLFKKLKLIELVELTGVNQYTVNQYRKKAHITIDEINTGSYHQVSLEGLSAGNVVINNSDIFSDFMLMKIAKSSEKVPFFKANNFNIYERLFELIQNHQKIRDYQTKSYNFYKKYLMPDKLIKQYIEIYEEVL